MNKRQQLAKIDEAFYALSRALESGRDFDTYYNQNLEEERGHRRFGRSFASATWAISAPQAARLFCVRQVAEYLNGQKAPQVKDIFSFRLSNYQAFALVEMHRIRLTEALSPFNLDELIAVDYAELVAA